MTSENDAAAPIIARAWRADRRPPRIAAERTGRKARRIEIGARYADTIVRRWQALTGQEATDAASGQMFKQRAAAGASDSGPEGA